MKVIFLDIDGVLCILEKGLARDEYGHLFDPYCVKNLAWLINKTGAKIVISSTWRVSGLQAMQDMWKKRNLPGEVIGVTPDCAQLVNFGKFEYYDAVERGHEIQEWLDINPQVTNYVIIDDEGDMLSSQKNHFVRVSSWQGLSEMAALECRQILL